MRVAIIGGGPSGLTTLKHLLAIQRTNDMEPIEVQLFESKEEIGGTFRYRVWEDAELVSSKYLTTFSDFRLDATEPDFVSTIRYVQYLEDYATHFNLWPHIHLSTPITSVRRSPSGGHVISYTSNGESKTWECDAVAICSGLHVEPSIPDIKGIENVETVMHSSQFKKREQFGKGKNIVVMGVGETAMDISHMAVTSETKSVTLCHRGGFVYAPKILSVPIFLSYFYRGPNYKLAADTTIASLFDTAYVHPWLQHSSLLWRGYDTWAKFYFWLVSGTKAGVDQWVGEVDKERYHLSSVILCKSGKAMPYISSPYRNRSLIDRLRASIVNIPIAPTRGRTIDLAPWPESISSTGLIKFTPSTRLEAVRMASIPVKPDILIFATGYTQKFPFLDSTYPVPLQADCRGIWKSDDVSVGFIGFVRPSLGAIPPLAELQAQLWVLAVTDNLPANHQSVDFSYKLRFKNIRREYEEFVVDHESYAYQLALDMGSAPSFTEVLGFGIKTTFVWAMGSNFNSKFRLVGPWKWDGAREVMNNELYTVVRESGALIFIFTYTIIPFIIFGSLSGICWVLCSVWEFLCSAKKAMTAFAFSKEAGEGKIALK